MYANSCVVMVAIIIPYERFDRLREARFKDENVKRLDRCTIRDQERSIPRRKTYVIQYKLRARMMYHTYPVAENKALCISIPP